MLSDTLQSAVNLHDAMTDQPSEQDLDELQEGVKSEFLEMFAEVHSRKRGLSAETVVKLVLFNDVSRY